MILAVGTVFNEEFLATGEDLDDAYKHLQEVSSIGPDEVKFFELTPIRVRPVVTFETI